jgi:hypothetical protein
MNTLLNQYRSTIASACRKYGVQRLAVFGSAARGDFDVASSDFDFVVRFNDTRTPGYADRYLDLAESLEGSLGRPVDLITERSIRNPILHQQIAKDSIVLYEDRDS